MDGKDLDSHWLLGGSDDFAPSDTLSNQRSGEVTIEGNLNKVNLVDIFKTITESKLVGTLYITRGNYEKCLYFRRGGLAIDSVGGEQKKRIGETMMELGFITMEQLNEVLAEKKGHLPVGQLLVARGYTTQVHIDQAIKFQMKQEVCDMFQWRHADFRFYQGEDPNEHADIDNFLRYTGFDTVEYLIRQSEIFQTIQRLQDKITLILRNDTKEIHLAFGQNRIALLTLYSPRNILIGQLLIQRNMLTAEQLEQGLSEQKQNYRPIGEILSDKGYITRSEVEDLIQEQATQELFSMFNSPTLHFSYVEGRTSEFATLKQQVSIVDFDNLNIILSAFRNIEDISDFYSVLPNAFGVLPFQAGNIIDVNDINLFQATQEICSRINRRFQIYELAFADQMTPFHLALICAHMIKDGIYRVNNDIRELSKLYKINGQWENYIASLELQFTFSPRELPLIYALGETYEAHHNLQRAAEFYLLAGDLNHENTDHQLEAYRKVLLLNPTKEAYQRVIQLLLEKEQFWDASELARQYVGMLSPTTELREIEELARSMIKLKSNVEFFHNKLIDIYKDQENLRYTVRELELLKSYYREEGREDDVSRLEKEILKLEESTTQSSASDTNTNIKRKKIRKPMSPLVKAMVFGVVFSMALGGGGFVLFTKYPNVIEEFLQKLGKTQTVDPIFEELKTLETSHQNIKSSPSFNTIQRLFDDCKNFRRKISLKPDDVRNQIETRLATIEANLKNVETILTVQKEHIEKAEKLFKEDYDLALNYYNLVAKENNGDALLQELAKKKIEDIHNYNQSAKIRCLSIQKSIEENNLPAAWHSLDSLVKETNLYPTQAFKNQKFPYLVVVQPPLPTLYKGEPLSQYPSVVYEKFEGFQDEALEVKQKDLFELTVMDPKKRLTVDPTIFKAFGNIRDLREPWIRFFQSQHKINWKTALEKGGRVFAQPIEFEGDTLFGSTNQIVYRMNTKGELQNQVQVDEFFADITTQILDFGNGYLLVASHNGKIYLLEASSLKKIGSYELAQGNTNRAIKTHPLRLSKDNFVISFQDHLYRFKITPEDPKEKIKFLWKWQLSGNADGHPTLDAKNDLVYVGGTNGEVYEVKIGKRDKNKVKPLYVLESREEILEAPILFDRNTLIVYSKNGSINVLSPRGELKYQTTIAGKPQITRWTYEPGSSYFYFGGDNGNLYCWNWDGTNSQLKEQQILIEGSIKCPPVLLGSNLYIGTEGRTTNHPKGAIYCVNFAGQPNVGEFVWSHFLTEGVTSLWFHTNLIVVALKNGELFSFEE